ncbi:MAG: MYXO-CTERM sorting domain-containing protein [Myxococcota bacterium]
MIPSRLLQAVVAIGLLGWGSSAHAFSTRVHIKLSNDVREALIASGDGTIRLQWSDGVVELPTEDADAIVNQPLAFRAGAIGPDNFVFPGMTDATHALGQNPFELCEILYRDAVVEEERAYALGCFLHGTTDAIAHHFVNFFTGETFTLTPLSADRASNFSNVVGHIVTESEIQRAFWRADPSDFDSGALQLNIPRGFVSRNFHDMRSDLWQRMMANTVERLDRTQAAMPDANLLEVVRGTELGPWEYLGLAPRFVEELQMQRGDLRDFVLAEIADMQDPGSARGMQLMVGTGPDGVLSTADDTTACDVSCAELWGRYRVFTNILLPRMDAGGRELPSAYDTISDDLGRQLNLFLPALLETIENLAVVLNTPLSSEDDSGFDLSPALITETIMPMREWVDQILAIDFDLLANAITPSWYRRLESLFASLGVDIRIGSLLEVLFGPQLDQIRTLIEEQVIGVAQTFLEDLTADLRAMGPEWEARVGSQLAASAPMGAGGHALDRVTESGLFAYSFNLVSATLANHELVVSMNEVATGAASFDASYTHHWTQAGLCDYLQGEIFPEGTSVGAVLSIRTDEMFFPAGAEEDSPVECHNGSLSMFGEPTRESCMVTTLESLFDDPTGSISRSYPPMWAAIMPQCRDIRVPGLPDPPDRPDAGPGDRDGGTTGDDGGTTGPDGGMMMMSSGGCGGCSTTSGDTPGGLFLVMLLLFGWRRRAGVALAALLAFGVGCGDDSTPERDAGVDSAVVDAAREDSATGMDAAMDSGGMDADMEMDAGPDRRRELLDALGSSTWNSLQSRTEGEDLVERAYEMRFEAGSLEWAEIRNPFGPARFRTLRSFSVMADGRTIESIILSPDGWPPHPRNGARETWEIEVVAGDPRILRLTNTDTDATEEFAEGEWPAPTEGLTAEVRVFGASGPIWDSFCGAGGLLDSFSVEEAQAFWEFARGESPEPDTGFDVVAGARLLEWDDSSDGANDFSVTDLDGMDRLGGTTLTTQFNWAVRYTGSITHPGGAFEARENDDRLEDGLWMFAQDGVGGSSFTSDVLLEVHNWANPDRTDDEVRISPDPAAGAVPFEVIAVRCGMPFAGKEMRAELRLGGGAWMLVGEQPSTPIINDDLFPPAL